MLQLRLGAFQYCASAQVIAGIHGFARFLQCSFRGRQIQRWLVQPGARRAVALGGIQERSTFGDECRKLGRGVVHLDTHARLGVRGVSSGVLRMFATVEGEAEGEPVIAGGDRDIGVLERFGRCGVLACCVPVGSGCLRGIDGALGLVHLLVGWLRARGSQRRQ